MKNLPVVAGNGPRKRTRLVGILLSIALWLLFQFKALPSLLIYPQAGVRHVLTSDSGKLIPPFRPPSDEGEASKIRQEFLLLSKGDNRSSWILEYVMWHHQMRTEFPDGNILDPGGPNVTIVYVDPAARPPGLTDRLNGIGHLFQHSYKTQRVFFLKWYDAPLQLEDFLIPNLVNFTLPNHPTVVTPEILRQNYEGGRNQRVLLGDEVKLGSYADKFGLFWHTIFLPSQGVQRSLQQTMTSLRLLPGMYDAIHIRSGHPAFRNTKQYDANAANIDRGEGLDVLGEYLQLAVEGALRAVRCSHWLSHTFSDQYGFNASASNATYLYSDSADLVRLILDPTTTAAVAESKQDDLGILTLLANLTYWSQEVFAVGRIGAPVGHLRRTNVSIELYESTFVDLYVAAQARCISLGVGRFGYLAGKIGGTKCWARHDQPSFQVQNQWGMKGMAHEVPKCPFV